MTSIYSSKGVAGTNGESQPGGRRPKGGDGGINNYTDCGIDINITSTAFNNWVALRTSEVSTLARFGAGQDGGEGESTNNDGPATVGTNIYPYAGHGLALIFEYTT
jgi:hypothetical protein